MPTLRKVVKPTPRRTAPTSDVVDQQETAQDTVAVPMGATYAILGFAPLLSGADAPMRKTNKGLQPVKVVNPVGIGTPKSVGKGADLTVAFPRPIGALPTKSPEKLTMGEQADLSLKIDEVKKDLRDAVEIRKNAHKALSAAPNSDTAKTAYERAGKHCQELQSEIDALQAKLDGCKIVPTSAYKPKVIAENLGQLAGFALTMAQSRAAFVTCVRNLASAGATWGMIYGELEAASGGDATVYASLKRTAHGACREVGMRMRELRSDAGSDRGGTRKLYTAAVEAAKGDDEAAKIAALRALVAGIAPELAGKVLRAK